MDLFELGDQIKSARKSRGMTQAELAEKSGISRVRLNQLESGNVFDMRFGNLVSVLGALDMDFRVVTANNGRPTFEELQEENERARRDDEGLVL